MYITETEKWRRSKNNKKQEVNFAMTHTLLMILTAATAERGTNST